MLHTPVKYKKLNRIVPIFFIPKRRGINHASCYLNHYQFLFYNRELKSNRFIPYKMVFIPLKCKYANRFILYYYLCG